MRPASANAAAPAADSLSIVRIPMDSRTRITPILAGGAPGNADTFDAMVRSARPYAAINGTFYDKSYRPLGHILVNGKLVNRGHYPNAVAFGPGGKIAFIRAGKGGFTWRGYTAGVAAGPRLVHAGRVKLDPNADGFTRRSLQIQAFRSGIAITADRTLLLVSSRRRMTLSEFASAMVGLGAVEALNLDGGGACGLYHKGRYLAYPPLPMTNIIAVFRPVGS